MHTNHYLARRLHELQQQELARKAEQYRIAAAIQDPAPKVRTILTRAGSLLVELGNRLIERYETMPEMKSPSLQTISKSSTTC